MKITVLTLFPDMVAQALHTSIVGRAMDAGILEIRTVDIRDYAENKHNSVDDYPYGGGAGMVMQAGPVVRAVRAAKAELPEGTRVVYTSPQGSVFTQETAKRLASEESLIILCGHYEGIDERALELTVDEEISIGDYVLTGGELPAMVMIDAVARLLPGVLHNDTSAETESHQESLLEYPQYSRPREFEGLEVPEVLLSGDHAKVDAWRREQSLLRTREKRPDLLEKAELTEKEKKFLANTPGE
ncbi:MAG: tRNA (guanosine(37)-N1)-methyltransferase TrmD [Lachnospiraceae bacterium]|nr:tRNA (guanosine(37)-N1)-methyltransferase TrmD [Lachnospiraceae bacterium]MBQ1516069.1 tRNA (guanosine(37)-N1)-methyltransferase TrmD [Lachnospiraceae bacterium]MBQ3400271.1 tRNA (guanosine(37)-N1)-methyltransferase TrmD [Lachnospiraceae bacterium]MBR0107380.1 tRNA (guanosine(37)-N1)-methyltransferase TrmD [Lachnospiraceae bacterium]